MRAARYSALLTLGQFSVFIAQPWWFHRASSWIISCKFINLTNTINLSHSQRALGIEGTTYSEKHALYDQLSNADRKLIEGLDPKGCDGKIFQLIANARKTPEDVRKTLTGLAQKLAKDLELA